MKESKVIIKNETGLHLRPISLIVNRAKEFAKCKISLEVDGETADAKSAFSIQELDLDYGVEVKIICDGEGEEKAVEEIKKIIEEAK